MGEYTKQLSERVRHFHPVQIFGEVFNFSQSQNRVYFELRDARGALPCSMWRRDFQQLEAATALKDGTQIVIAGHCDYYVGNATSSPAFSFTVLNLSLAGEGELLAELARLRKKLHAEGLFEPQKRLYRPQLPKRLGIVTAPTGKARTDVLAALARRGWRGTIVWGYAPVQDRYAAPAITSALTELAAVGEVEAIIVTRGGGALADLFAFCDETLCRTVAALPVPVIASVGHHTDRTLLDDVAAAFTSTPTHAAEAAVPLDCTAAQRDLSRAANRLTILSHTAVMSRAQTLRSLALAPRRYIQQLQMHLHQQTRELRASSRRQLTEAQPQRLATWRAALVLHDPQATLQRGYALVETATGNPLTSAAAARTTGPVRLRFHDGCVTATINSTDE